jgi:VWFA-related protein
MPVALRADVTVVEVPVVVRDGRHRAVAGLTRDDFELYDSGRRQTITAFSVQHLAPQAGGGAGATPAAPAHTAAPQTTPRPRFVALCFDDLHTGAADLKAAKDAAERFVKTSLALDDRVAVVTTAAPSEHPAFTADVPRLIEQIARVASRERSDYGYCPPMEAYEAYLIANSMDKALLASKLAECAACNHQPACPETQVTSLAQSVWEHTLANSTNTLRLVGSLVDGMANLPGERMILLTSANLLTGNLESDVDRLISRTLHAGVVINSLDAKRLHAAAEASEPSPSAWVPPRAQAVKMRTEAPMQEARNDGMALLAAGTGGAFYHGNNDLASGFRELGMVPETLYILSFAPSGVPADGRFHSLKVRLAAGKRYSLQARLGYTASSPNAAPPSPPSRLDSEAMASDTIADLPAWFTWEQWEGPPGITMVAHLDVNRLHFETRQDRRTQKLTIVAVLLDSHGSFVTGKRSELELNFTNATFSQLAKSGLTVAMTMPAPPGNYGVRALAQDALEGKLTAAGGTVHVK